MTRTLAVGLALLLLVSGAPGALGAAPAAARDPVRDGGPVTAAPLPAPPGRTGVLSRARNGGFANGGSLEPSMSENGRFVAFTSIASNLVANDEPGTVDVFALDRQTGRVRMAPLPAGLPRTTLTSSSEPSISANGRFVVFTYTQPPVAGTTAGVIRRYVIVWDRERDVSTFASPRASRVPVQGRQPSISEDGQFVAYTTPTDLAGDKDGGEDDVVRFDRRTERFVLLSPGFNGEPIGGVANAPSISGDGHLVAFVSDGGDSVIDADTGSGFQVYVRNVDNATTEQVSLADDERPPRDDSIDPAISADGRFVAFSSQATNLTEHGSPGLFRRDLVADATILVSVAPDGSAGKGTSVQPSITRDGNMIAWTSTASNLVPETLGTIGPAATTRLPSDTYIRDIAVGETLLVSVSLANGSSGGQSFQPSIAGNGRFIAFASDSAQLVRNDDNKAFDVFLRDLPPVPVINPSSLDLGSRAVGTESLPLAATLGNGGWTPLRVTGASLTGPDRGDFRIVADGCQGKLLARNQACTVSVVFRPRDQGNRTATLAVADRFDGSPRTVRLRGRGSQAKVVLNPSLGQPGVVTIVEGSGFPPATPVRLRWSRGIMPGLDPVVTDARGRFRVQVLVFHHDLTGPRDLLVEPLDGTAFPSIGATMLVTKPSVVPPRFTVLRFIDIPLVLVIRG